jgi:hypothetical protein
MPEPEFRLCADYYLLNLAPLYGPIDSLAGIGGHYRVHGENRHYGHGLDLEKVRRIIARTQTAQQHIHRVAGRLGYYGVSNKPIEDASVTFLAHRLVSYRFGRRKHPVAGDGLASLALQGIHSAIAQPALPVARKLMWVLWFALVAAAPEPLSRWLAKFFYRDPIRAG